MSSDNFLRISISSLPKRQAFVQGTIADIKLNSSSLAMTLFLKILSQPFSGRPRADPVDVERAKLDNYITRPRVRLTDVLCGIMHALAQSHSTRVFIVSDSTPRWGGGPFRHNSIKRLPAALLRR